MSKASKDDEVQFCKKMIKLTKQNVKNRTVNSCAQHDTSSLQISPKNSKSVSPDSEDASVVSLQLLDRIKAENVVRLMNKANSQTLHDPNSCKKCQNVEGEILKKEFLRCKTCSIENHLMDRKVDCFLLKNNPLSMIGELASNLPRPTEEPQKIWECLIKRNVI